ncbi:hypothetical protein [Pseudomonas sp. Q1-7]|uniref:hypothetical protein n=1 Tax=Pseudomonas sp. Q1-7 TaxID=3020843 RepID=UPI00230099F2|nr:hypothetical protein [Pseudomonas sp. Q1-7]
MKRALWSGIDQFSFSGVSRTWMHLSFLGGYLLLAFWSFLHGAGSLPVLVMFHFSFLLLTLLAFAGFRSDGYCYLAFFLFLGFWLKWLVHEIFEYPFVEPVGNYLGEPGQVDVALSIASVASLGVAASRLLHVYVERRFCAVKPVSAKENIPSIYSRWFLHIWVIFVLLSFVLYFFNYRFSFFQVGVNARLVLPSGVNAIAAWLVCCGMPMIFSLLLDWEISRKPDRYWPAIYGVCIFALIMSVSMASRAVLPFLYLAVGGCLYFHKREYLVRMIALWTWRLPLLMSGFFAFSLILVSAFRLDTYQPSQPSQSSVTSIIDSESPSSLSALDVGRAEDMMLYRGTFFQVLRLGVDRWIGIEGALAVASSEGQGISLLMAGLMERPSAGVDALYQRISGSFYKHQEGLTFLTLPGAAAVLFYSGSFSIVFFGMMALASIVFFVERLAVRMTGSHLVSSWVALLVANSVCQMNFPYLWGVFILECCVALLVLGFTHKFVIREHSDE